MSRERKKWSTLIAAQIFNETITHQYQRKTQTKTTTEHTTVSKQKCLFWHSYHVIIMIDNASILSFQNESISLICIHCNRINLTYVPPYLSLSFYLFLALSLSLSRVHKQILFKLLDTQSHIHTVALTFLSITSNVNFWIVLKSTCISLRLHPITHHLQTSSNNNNHFVNKHPHLYKSFVTTKQQRFFFTF